MALTAAQETVLEQLIEAFQNGKRLSDLPNVKGTNPLTFTARPTPTARAKKQPLPHYSPTLKTSAPMAWSET